jgi:glucosamine 6-phosphate synthetase-like amidotransferase/phosphosugar isomerase protein
MVAISQSGETVDTLFAVKAAEAASAKVLAVCNVVDRAIPRLADGALYTHAGPEIGSSSSAAAWASPSPWRARSSSRRSPTPTPRGTPPAR